jgi:hypothetical protein
MTECEAEYAVCGPLVIGKIMDNGLHGRLCEICGGESHGNLDDLHPDGKRRCNSCCEELHQSYKPGPYDGLQGIVARGFRTSLGYPYALWRSTALDLGATQELNVCLDTAGPNSRFRWRSGVCLRLPQFCHPPIKKRRRQPYGPPCAGCYWGTSYRGVRGRVPGELLSEYELCPDCHAACDRQ